MNDYKLYTATKIMTLSAVVIFAFGIFLMAIGPVGVFGHSSTTNVSSSKGQAELAPNVVNVTSTPSHLELSAGGSVLFTVKLTSLTNNLLSFNVSSLDLPPGMHLSLSQTTFVLSPGSTLAFQATLQVDSNVAAGAYVIGLAIGQIHVNHVVIVS